MALGWEWTEDRQWAHSKWSKRLHDGDTKITWYLEVQFKDLLLGELVLKGNLDGELTISLQRLHKDFS